MPPLAGQVQLFALDFVPRDWLPCDGRLLPIRDFPVLFSLLGTRFGGDGRGSFGLPDLRGAAPAAGTSYCIAGSGTIPLKP